MDPELVCYNPSTEKSEGMGELVGGMIFDISLGMARRLLANRQKDEGGIAALEHIAEKLAFEIAVGRNGQVWVKAAGIKETLAIGKALQETDKQSLGLQSQEKLVQKLLREIWHILSWSGGKGVGGNLFWIARRTVSFNSFSTWFSTIFKICWTSIKMQSPMKAEIETFQPISLLQPIVQLNGDIGLSIQ